MNVNKGFVDVKGEFNAEESVMFFIWEKSVKYGASFIFFPSTEFWETPIHMQPLLLFQDFFNHVMLLM